MKVLLAVAMSAVLAGCGGSSSGDSATELPLDDTTNDAIVDTANEVPVVDITEVETSETEAPEEEATDTEVTDTEVTDTDASETEAPATDTTDLDTPLTQEGDFQVLLHEGELIPGSDGLTLGSIRDTDHTASGWYAATLGYENEGASTSGSGIWRGQEGTLVKVFDTDDAIQGYPANVFTSSIRSIDLATDGTIWANVILASSGDPEFAVIEITPEGDIVGNLRTGDRVPNTDTGTVVVIIGDVYLAGNEVYARLEANIARNFLIHVTSANQNIVFSSSPDYGPSADQLPDSIQNCSIGNSLVSEDTFSESGAVLFTSSALGEGCPLELIMQYEDGAYTLHLATGRELPIGDGSFIPNFSLFGILGLAPDNKALVRTLVRTPNDTLIDSLNDAFWLTSSGEDPQLVAFEGETLPPDFENFVDLNMSFSDRFKIASGSQVAGLLDTGGGDSIFTGAARTDQPYTTYLSVGASQLERVINDSDTIPGFGETSSYLDFENLTFTETGKIWFQSMGSFVDPSDEESRTRTNFNGVWRIDPGQEPRLEFSDTGSLIIFNNEVVRFRDVSGFSTNTNNDVFVLAITSGNDDVLLFREGTD